MKLLFRMFLCLFLFNSIVHAYNSDSLLVADSIKKKIPQTQKKEQPRLMLNLVMVDFPYQVAAAKTVNNGNVSLLGFLKGYANPSMHQSLQLTTSLYSGLHYGIDKLFKKDLYNNRSKRKGLFHNLTLALGDYLLTTAPGFDGWLHEEFHRSVMTRFGVESYNEMNEYPIGSEIVRVSHVYDQDLIRFKKQSPSDFIRMHVAGIEGGYLLAEKLQKNNFFYKQNLSHQFTYLLNIINAIFYVNISANSLIADRITDQMNIKETTIPIRDFTGLDFQVGHMIFSGLTNHTIQGEHIPPVWVSIDILK